MAKFRARLGSNAVVLNVRPLPSNGIARLWQKPMIEVLAHVPESEPEMDEKHPIHSVLDEFREQLREIREKVHERSGPVPAQEATSDSGAVALDSFTETVPLKLGSWKVSSYLQKSGLLPVYTYQVLNALVEKYGENPPDSLIKQIELANQWLAGEWRITSSIPSQSMHVLVGPSGSGKTTCLCKWLTQASLMESRSTRVWRLDGATANMAEALSVYCEILGMPCERNWQGESGAPVLTEDIGFIDLPGVDWRQPAVIKELSGLLKKMGSPRVHLVLNAAYDSSILLAQARAFSALPVEDLVLTHLDEETRWGKIWNLVLGTNFPIRHLSTGQNIPGDYTAASSEKIIKHQNR